MSSDSDLEKRARAVVAEQLNVEETSIKNESSFTNDLGADSLDVVELVMAFEEEFDLEIPDDDSENLTTFGAALSYIKERSS